MKPVPKIEEIDWHAHEKAVVQIKYNAKNGPNGGGGDCLGITLLLLIGAATLMLQL